MYDWMMQGIPSDLTSDLRGKGSGDGGGTRVFFGAGRVGWRDWGVGVE